MALIFMDGCDNYLYNYLYYSGNAGSYSGSFFGTAYNNGDVSYRRSLIATNDKKAYFGSWVRTSPSNVIAIFYNSDASQGQTININGQGALTITSWQGGVVASSTTVVGDSQWHWVEVKIDTVAGVAQAYMDGNLILNYSGSLVNSGTVSYDILRLGGGVDRDDIVWYSDLDPGLNGTNFPLGPQRIVTIRPNSDDTVQFSRDGGLTNFSRINESSTDTSNYVFANTSGLQDLYNMSDLTFTPSTIKALSIKTIAQNGGDGTIAMNQIVKSGSNTYTSNSFTMFYNPRMFTTILETDETSGGIGWTPTTINNIKIGQKVT